MDISAWLRELGLERYEEAFQRAEIDLEVLADLTDADLRELGIPLGPRRKLLQAISVLAAGAEPPFARETKRSEAERRQLTVLFCDLVGSTELAARLDPEDLREVMRTYQAACASVVGRFEGHVARFWGDGVLAYFGWPQAHEDDAERAVRAGLQLVQEIPRLEPGAGERLGARVGIATGHVVVGDLIGAEVSDKDAVSGDTPNLAARLQAIAAPGNVVISPSTRRLVGNLFELTHLGPQRLKGFAEPLSAWQVEGQRRAKSRFEARETAGLTPLVGREEEIALLLGHWRQAQGGEGQVVLLSGEAGIGKSRLVRELRERIAAEPHVRLTHQCSPYHASSPLHPVIEHLERAAGFEGDDPPEARLAKLEALLARGTDKLDEAVSLITAVLGIASGERYPALELTPQRQKELTLEALLDQFAALAVEQPVLLVHEDVHWIDPTTQELLSLAIARTQRLPVLTIITFRPEFTPPWPGQPHVSALRLTRLGRREGAAMVHRVVGPKTLPDEVTAQIVAKTDGVPLFVEELTKAVLESGLLADAGGHYELSGPIPPLAIPATLHDSLLARLDHLAPAKEVAQIGAALGRDFSHALLAAVTDWPEDQLRDALNQLVCSALIFRRGSPPKATYSFKHALVQDAAYQTLLKSKRKQLHTRIVSTLEQYFPETVKSQPEVLARHCDLGGMTEQAIDYWHRAGELAARRSAVMEAAMHFNRALELLRTSPRTAERLKRELDFLTKLGSVLISAKGPASDEVARVYTDARVLCRSPGETPHLVPVLQGLRVNHMLRAELRPAREAAAELLALGERVQDAGHLLEGNLAVGILHFYAGEFLPAREHLEKGITFYQTAQHRSHTLRYPDPGQSCLSYTARTLWVLGYPDQALERSEQAVHIADDTSDATSIVQAMAFRADIASLRREFRDAENWARKALDIATEHGLRIWVGGATVTHGWALSQLGRNTAGVSEIKDGRKFLANLRDRLYGIYSAGYLAEALSMTGRPREALKQLKKAIVASQSFELPYWDSAFYRLMGQLLLAPGARTDSRAAEACFRQAIEIAQGQQAKSLELRAATSLARLWTDQGNRTEARDLLAPVYGWFTEGFDTADLKDAKSLLDELC